jgi:2-oxoglutarate ferredoxin oxidoreductase subunit gamma
MGSEGVAVEFEVLISGIGGQGIQLVAKSMALAAMAEGRMPLLTSEVSGAMRGGHSLAAVVIGDGPLKGLPVVTEAAAAIVFHPMLWDDVARRLQPGATVVANANLVHLDPSGGAIELWEVPATELASGLGSLQVLGFIMLGAFAALTSIVAIESLVDAMTEMLPPYRRQHAEANRRALELGAAQLPAGGAPVRFPEPAGRPA